MLQIKRVYESPSSQDGYRVLVDRLWPRGVSKEEAAVDLWLKEIGPTNELREWFNHDPEKFQEFSRRYKKELQSNQAVDELKKAIKNNKKVTLLYGAKDQQHNQAVVLQQFLSHS